MYDSRLTDHTLYYLHFAPVLYALYGCWLFSNQQVFQNVVSPITSYNLFPLQQHNTTDLFTQLTPGTLFLIFVIALTILFFISKIYRRCNRGFSIKDMVTIEVLEPFYTMLKNKDREFWFREESGCRERLGIKRVQPLNFLQLVFASRNKKGRRVRAVHNYDILTNPIYSDKFLYVPNAYEGREDYIISEYKDPWLQ